MHQYYFSIEETPDNEFKLVILKLIGRGPINLKSEVRKLESEETYESPTEALDALRKNAERMLFSEQ